jgi:nucleoside-diphosphate-sugar epimerase
VKVFLTGGTGLVGRHIIAALAGRGDTVRALARSDRAVAELTALGAEPARGDLSAATRFEPLMEGCDAVVHAAAIVLSGGRWEAWREVNVLGTERVVRSAARSGARVVHLSSVAVYGHRRASGLDRVGHDEEFDLEHAPVPPDPYERSKREAELVLWEVARATGLSAVALRPCVLYGEGDRHFSPRVAKLLRRGVVPLIGGGTNHMTLVYAGSVAAAVTCALDRPGAGGPFNITNDGTLTLREFAERFAAGLGVRPRWLRIPRGLAWSAARAWDRTGGALLAPWQTVSLSAAVQFLAGENPYDSSRASRLLQWRPPVDAAEAAERTGASFRAPARPRAHP